MKKNCSLHAELRVEQQQQQQTEQRRQMCEGFVCVCLCAGILSQLKIIHKIDESIFSHNVLFMCLDSLRFMFADQATLFVAVVAPSLSLFSLVCQFLLKRNLREKKNPF